MAENDWRKIEYASLRAEILSRDEAERAAVRFFLPAGAAVYTIPYFVSAQKVATTESAFVYLWTFCAAVASLLVLLMVLSLFWAADGTRKIGTYIKEVIEPETNGEMRWESVVYELAKQSNHWPNETFVVACGAVLGNLLASTAISLTFLRGKYQFAPLIVAAAVALLTAPGLWRLLTVSTQRERHANVIKKCTSPMKKKAG